MLEYKVQKIKADDLQRREIFICFLHSVLEVLVFWGIQRWLPPKLGKILNHCAEVALGEGLLWGSAEEQKLLALVWVGKFGGLLEGGFADLLALSLGNLLSLLAEGEGLLVVSRVVFAGGGGSLVFGLSLEEGENT